MSGYDSFCCFRSGTGGTGVRLLCELNTTCNLACEFCHTANETRDPGREHDAIVADLQRLSKSGVDDIIFSGGEPLLRSDLLDLLSAARGFGFTVDVCTNGTLVTAAMARALCGVLSEISVSIDCIVPHVYDQMRGRQGSYYEAMRGLAALQDAGVVVHAISVANSLTLPYVEETLYALDGLGLDSVTVLGEMSTSTVPCPDQAHVARTVMSIVKEVRRTARCGINTKRLVLPMTGQVCPAGTRVLGMDVRGRVLPCILFKKLYEEDRARDWTTLFQKARDRSCTRCECLPNCHGGCPGAAALACGSIDIDPLCDRKLAEDLCDERG